MLTVKNTAASVLLLFALFSDASPIAERDTDVTVKFDDISNSFPIPDMYNQFNWPGFIVSSPNRFNGEPYVAYASEFQYARAFSGTTGKIQRYSNVAPYLLVKSLRFGCSQPNDDTTNPGVPKGCTLTIKENCANKANSRTITAKFTPSMALASPMKKVNLAKGQKCAKAVSYSFVASGQSDVLLDNVSLREIDVVQSM